MRGPSLVVALVLSLGACGGRLSPELDSEPRIVDGSESGPEVPSDSPADPEPAVGSASAYEDFYVAPNGSDYDFEHEGRRPGLREHPLGSVDRVLGLLDGDLLPGNAPVRIFVCGRTSGALVVRARFERELTIAGGFDCGTWLRNGRRLTLSGLVDSWRARPVGQVPREIQLLVYGEHDTGFPVVIEGLEIERALIHGAAAVFRRSRVFAPRGQDGSAGYGRATFAEEAGVPSGGNGGKTICGQPSGIPGGQPTRGGDAPSGSGTPSSLGTSPNGGIEGVSCAAGGDGHAGASGLDGSDAPPTPNLGQYDRRHGFVPHQGIDGASGAPGQGGGAGAGPSAGGGGAGGCGGSASGGAAGGASIAVLSIDARVRFEDTILHTYGGGNGGAGTPPFEGANGQPGEVPPAGEPSCSGGPGGKGGTSGASGGGAGGSSVGVLYTGTRPILDDASRASMIVRPAGLGGAGGAPANRGLDGMRAALIECDTPAPEGSGLCH